MCMHAPAPGARDNMSRVHVRHLCCVVGGDHGLWSRDVAVVLSWSHLGRELDGAGGGEGCVWVAGQRGGGPRTLGWTFSLQPKVGVSSAQPQRYHGHTGSSVCCVCPEPEATWPAAWSMPLPYPGDLSCSMGPPHPWAPPAVRSFQAFRCGSHGQILIALSGLRASV